MSELARSIGLIRGTFMMLNIVLGAGLLTLPGLAAIEAGQAAPFVWVACALIAIPLLWVFAILGQSRPCSGGVPAWAGAAFGEWAYIPAVLLFLGAVGVGLPSIAITGGHYAAETFGGNVYVLAGLLIAGATVVNLLSAEMAGRMNAAIASVILVVLIAIAAIGFAVTEADQARVSASSLPMLDLTTFGTTFMLIFFAFTGWEVAANLSGEFRNPTRNIPWAIGLSFLIATLLYGALAWVVLAAGPNAHSPAPFVAIFGNAFGPTGSTLIGLTAIAMIFANLSAAIWAVSRLVYVSAGDGILPRGLYKVTRGMPLRAVALTVAVLLAITAGVGSGLFTLSNLLAAAGQNFLLLYAAAAFALLKFSERTGHKVLALFSIVIVLGVLMSRPLDALYYPLALCLTGGLFAVARTRFPTPTTQ